ncbi:MAG: hypothetical protein GWN21_12450 [Gammaproteobacteria bacterium]|nr:hypothetical protein [Gammaproteobacteria bacterium]NIV48396.1 hypothetical protein [Gammaproteobacteria bacterium]NIW56027.1 hypothetical protein [Gammaproteobacteria bacterium]NIX04998.1 hypothetical protein [Gammaproteobacteria bacterium]
MSTNDLEQELARLRAEIKKLSAARKDSAAAEKAPEKPPKAVAPAAAAAAGAGAPEAEEPVHSQLNELLELLEAEIKDLPTITCLIVFSLGILMGRFLR